MSAPRVLLVSNGYGEMAILDSIARALLAEEPNVQLAHMPLVGRLAPDAWPKPVGPQSVMPSGGLVTYWNVRNMARDVRSGLLGLSLRQFAFLLRTGRSYDAIVAVGDVYCAAACMWFGRRPVVFVATAKSQYVSPHSAIEAAIARHARVMFARDAATAEALSRAGVRARYAGNVMMDAVAAPGVELPTDDAAIRVAVLPGSRGDAPANASAAVRRLERIAELTGKRVAGYVALAPAVPPSVIIHAIANEGIALESAATARGVIARGAIARDGRTALDIFVVREAFGAVLRRADVVLGQSGTGNEQAAGLGKPVIASAEPGESPQSVGWYRMRQQKLLGDALLVLPADDETFAREVVALLADAPRIATMAAAGRERMGGPGGARAVASAILETAKNGAR